ncbi:hypothetical protein BJ165DRAFT_1532301 [Panaeolus papilionaceus]|nr:hypothetical protein BJ165DRAFT_1532301 [Panaeolus papilionaceus]
MSCPTEKALFLEPKGGDFCVGETEITQPGPGEILIKVQAAGLNPRLEESEILPRPAWKLHNRLSAICHWSSHDDGQDPRWYLVRRHRSIASRASAAYAAVCNPNPDGLGFTPPKSKSDEGKYGGEPIVVLGGATSVGQLVSAADTQKLAMDIVTPREQILIVYLATEKPTAKKRINFVLGVLRMPPHIELLENLYHDLISDWLATGALKPNRVEVLPRGLNGIPGGLRRLEVGEVSQVKLIARPQDLETL